MLEYLWGLKTVATFDVWTIEHFLSGMSVGSAVLIYNHENICRQFSHVKGKLNTAVMRALKCRYDIFLVLLAAFIWETLEHYLEVGLAGQNVLYWFQGVEFWSNRMIADPLMLVLGYLLVRRYKTLVVPARILSALWLFVHIFVFPHSMYLHEIV